MICLIVIPISCKTQNQMIRCSKRLKITNIKNHIFNNCLGGDGDGDDADASEVREDRPALGASSEAEAQAEETLVGSSKGGKSTATSPPAKRKYDPALDDATPFKDLFQLGGLLKTK
jgi:hypothetical protein